MQTFDNAMQTDASGNAMGKRLPVACTTHDGKTVDSTGAFLVGELERLDPTLHEPLAAVTWSRDIDLREDVTIADEVSSFTLSTYGSAGGLGTGNGIGNGKAWIGKNSNEITGMNLDISKIPHPLHLWGMELKYTIPELESAARLGRPIDQQKFDGLQLKYQMDIDEQVYLGDLTLGDPGLLTSSLVTPVTFPNGAGGSSHWSSKTPDEILADFNSAITAVWAATGYSMMPDRVILPPLVLGYLATTKVSEAGNVSILKYIKDNNILMTSGNEQGAKNLSIVATKWNIGTGVGGTVGVPGTVDRMVVYTKDKKRVRFPMTSLQRTPIQFESIWQKTTYYGRLGVVEIVYPETIGYYDGL